MAPSVTCDFDRTTVCERFKPLVSSTVAKLNVARDMREDAEQEGMIGLLNAFDHYDQDSAVHFSLFARSYVKGAILRGVYSKEKEVSFGLAGDASDLESMYLRPSTDLSGTQLCLTEVSREVFRLRCPSPQPLDTTDDAVEVVRLHEWMDTLSPDDSWLVGRRFWHGATSTEIATELNHTVHWVNERQRTLLALAAAFLGSN